MRIYSTQIYEHRIKTWLTELLVRVLLLEGSLGTQKHFHLNGFAIGMSKNVHDEWTYNLGVEEWSRPDDRIDKQNERPCHDIWFIAWVTLVLLHVFIFTLGLLHVFIMNQVTWLMMNTYKQVKYQEEYMQQAKCYPGNKPNVMIHEKYMQQAKYQDECMQQVKCYPCNKPSVILMRNTCKNPSVKRNTLAI